MDPLSMRRKKGVRYHHNQRKEKGKLRGKRKSDLFSIFWEKGKKEEKKAFLVLHAGERRVE